MAEETPMQKIAREAAARATEGGKTVQATVPKQEALQAASESGDRS